MTNKGYKNLVSVVTVTCCNSKGLDNTLYSIEKIKYRPLEVIVVDCGKDKKTNSVISQYKNKIDSIIFISENDLGIYDAMNKGLNRSRGNLIHYLNAGDTISGEPYKNIAEPCLIPVKIHQDQSNQWFDKIKLSGFGYCHQGIIFPKNHEKYDLKFKIAADYNLIIKTFKYGLNNLETYNTGYANYFLGGISSLESKRGQKEILEIAKNELSSYEYLKTLFILNLKSFFPRNIKRVILKLLWKYKII